MEIVNGYVCRNCSDAELATRNIDPAHPKDGPFGAAKIEDEKAAEASVAKARADLSVGPMASGYSPAAVTPSGEALNTNFEARPGSRFDVLV